MRLLRRGPEKTSPEVKTPVVLQEHVFKSHPLDVDSDSEASYTSNLDNQADFSCFPGQHDGQKPPASPRSTAGKLTQQINAQRADFIASHTPTSLSKAHKMAGSMQSLAHEAALAAANRAGNVSKSIEAATSTRMGQIADVNHQSDGMLGQEVQQPSKQAGDDAAGEAKSYSAGVLDWALSTLYFTAGVAAAFGEGIARGVHSSYSSNHQKP